MLKIDHPVVVHTDQPELIRKARRGRENITHIVSYNSVMDLFLYTKYGRSAWQKQITLDGEAAIHKHSFDLYLVWNMKPHFVKQAADSNLWQSEYFFWVDIGSQRHDGVEFKSWPDDTAVSQIPEGKVIFMWVGQEASAKDGKVRDHISLEHINRVGSEAIGLNTTALVAKMCEKGTEYTKVRYLGEETGSFIAGGIFGGRKHAVEQYDGVYYALLDQMLRTDTFAGDDQNVIALALMRAPTLLWLIPAAIYSSDACGNMWFYLWLWLSAPASPQLQPYLKKGCVLKAAGGSIPVISRSSPIFYTTAGGAPRFSHCSLPGSNCSAAYQVFQPAPSDLGYKAFSNLAGR
jgi:hypothetical protein